MSFDILLPEAEEVSTDSNVQEESNPIVTIKVIGVGGGGVNAVNSMIDAKVSNVEFYAINTDKAMLSKSKCDEKIQIGKEGFGVGGDPQKGRQCANESIE